jgi:hypothetical protein
LNLGGADYDWEPVYTPVTVGEAIDAVATATVVVPAGMVARGSINITARGLAHVVAMSVTALHSISVHGDRDSYIRQTVARRRARDPLQPIAGWLDLPTLDLRQGVRDTISPKVLRKKIRGTIDG